MQDWDSRRLAWWVGQGEEGSLRPSTVEKPPSHARAGGCGWAFSTSLCSTGSQKICFNTKSGGHPGGLTGPEGACNLFERKSVLELIRWSFSGQPGLMYRSCWRNGFFCGASSRPGLRCSKEVRWLLKVHLQVVIGLYSTRLAASDECTAKHDARCDKYRRAAGGSVEGWMGGWILSELVPRFWLGTASKSAPGSSLQRVAC